MTVPTDGDDHHPDLSGLAGEMRSQWRDEQDRASADAAAQLRHGRSLCDWLRDRMHAGDRIGVAVAARRFVGVVEEVGADLLVLRCDATLVEIHLSPEIPIALELVEHPTRGGTRGGSGRRFRDALLARDGRSGIEVGALPAADPYRGRLLVGRDFVTIENVGAPAATLSIAHVAWAAPTRDESD